MENIPFHSLPDYRVIHREESTDDFGMNVKETYTPIEGFELYSSNGRKRELGPMRNDFFRIALSLSGATSVTIGLETYMHGVNTVAFIMPDQIFSIANVNEEVFGYYLLFSPSFLCGILRETIMTDISLFTDMELPLFTLSEKAATEFVAIFHKLDRELKGNLPDRESLIKLGILEMLIIAKREYIAARAGDNNKPHSNSVAFRAYKKLVQKHFREKRSVAEYAEMMAMTPNHLNRIIKEACGKTASDLIRYMLLLESKVLIKYTELTISEIAWQLNFTDPTHFVKFFRKEMQVTPLQYRHAGNLP